MLLYNKVLLEYIWLYLPQIQQFIWERPRILFFSHLLHISNWILIYIYKNMEEVKHGGESLKTRYLADMVSSLNGSILFTSSYWKGPERPLDPNSPFDGPGSWGTGKLRDLLRATQLARSTAGLRGNFLSYLLSHPSIWYVIVIIRSVGFHSWRFPTRTCCPVGDLPSSSVTLPFHVQVASSFPIIGNTAMNVFRHVAIYIVSFGYIADWTIDTKVWSIV